MRTIQSEINKDLVIYEILKEDRLFPENLREISPAPKQIYCIGDLKLLEGPCAAIVGARKATSYGSWVAFNAAKKLAKCGIVTVSGMAFGVDSEAHRGAISEGGKTIAVFGCGPDYCYPPGNRDLYNKILETGLVISEYAPGKPPFKGSFPARNRIISGLSQVVLIAEAGLSSGSLITADFAVRQGKTVFAAPGNINALSSLGCNKLIAEGAFPLVLPGDIPEFMGYSAAEITPEVEENLAEDERRIYDVVRYYGEISRDKLCAELGMNPKSVNPVVSVMEIKGLVGTYMGKIFLAK